MSQATPQMRVWSQCLIAYEAGENYSSGTNTAPGFFALEKLRPRLAEVTGKTGFSALTSRALALAKAEVPAVRVIRINEQGAFEGLDQFEAQFERNQRAEGEVVLLARLLGLLVTLIGENLTAQIVGEVWPELSATKLG
jgi:hypothetical protein